MKRPPGTEVDYRGKLSAEDKAWLQKFDQESIYGYFKKGQKTLLDRRSLSRKEVDHQRYIRKEESRFIPVCFSATTDRCENPENALIHGIDALSTKSLGEHLRNAFKSKPLKAQPRKITNKE